MLPTNPKKRSNFTQAKSANPPIRVSSYIQDLNYNERETTDKRKFDVWIGFALSVVGIGTSELISDLSGYSKERVKRRLPDLTLLAEPIGYGKGKKWRSKLTYQEVGQLYLHLTKDEVDKRRRKMLEGRRDYHLQKHEYLAANGVFKLAAIHLQYAEKYEAILEAA